MYQIWVNGVQKLTEKPMRVMSFGELVDEVSIPGPTNVRDRLVWGPLLIRNFGKIIHSPQFVMGGPSNPKFRAYRIFLVDFENYESLLKFN